MGELLLVVIAVTAFALLEGLGHLLRFLRERREDELGRRLRQVGEAREASPRLLRRGRLSASPKVAEWLSDLRPAIRLERLIDRSGLDLTVSQILATSGTLALVVVTAGVFAGFALPLLLVVAAGVAVAPLGFLVMASDRRTRALSEQLPDALDMLGRSLKAGHSLAAALKLVATEMPLPIALEFARAFEEQNLGLPLEQAIVGMTQRAPDNRDFKMLAVAVILQRETGGNLVEILDQLALTIRARYTFQRKLRTLSAEGRISALILGFLPIGMGCLLMVVRPEYFAKLGEDPMGAFILAYAGASWITGMMWLRMVTKIEL